VPRRTSVEEVWQTIASMVENGSEGHSVEIFALSFADDVGVK
jgi:hypothetical protein